MNISSVPSVKHYKAMSLTPPPIPRQRAHSIPPPLPPEVALSPLLLALIPMLSKFCKSDGVVSASEIHIVDSFFQETLQLSQEQRRSAILLFRRSKEAALTFERHVRDYAAMRPEYAVVHMTVDLLMTIALSDGDIAHAEEEMLNTFVRTLGLSDSSFHEFKRRRARRHETAKSTRVDRRSQSLATLGLDKGASQKEVKAAYRLLVTQYHPDKVQQLGQKLRDVAEEEMKRINDAYSFLTANSQ